MERRINNLETNCAQDLGNCAHEKSSSMIPEASGATAVGILLLTDAFLKAARGTARTARKVTDGPIRLLLYHSCQLYLKAFLR